MDFKKLLAAIFEFFKSWGSKKDPSPAIPEDPNDDGVKPVPSHNRFPLSTSGGKIVDSMGIPVVLTGVNWFGMETGTFSPHGLWSRGWESMLDQVVQCGFNCLRIPYSNQLLEPQSVVGSIDTKLNADLVGKSGLEVLTTIVNGATARGLMVILDRHRPTAEAQSELWYTPEVTEARWIMDWVMLANLFKSNPLVIGADLHNEPHGRATWGTGDMGTDWRLAAERCGNAILMANPNWLILVEGIESYDNQWRWWGSNLLGARQHPVRLNIRNKLVYSPHDYGPEIWQQSWFQAPDFPTNLPAFWDGLWGYLVKEDIAPVLVGEFGAKMAEDEGPERMWLEQLKHYLGENKISWTFWSWNPNSGDTGGILLDDWQTVNDKKINFLRDLLHPRV